VSEIRQVRTSATFPSVPSAKGPSQSFDHTRAIAVVSDCEAVVVRVVMERWQPGKKLRKLVLTTPSVFGSNVPRVRDQLFDEIREIMVIILVSTTFNQSEGQASGISGCGRHWRPPVRTPSASAAIDSDMEKRVVLYIPSSLSHPS